jgi:DNA-binding response OmpR family regulator
VKKILIMDNDRVLRQTLAAALEAEGYGRPGCTDAPSRGAVAGLQVPEVAIS